MTKRYKLGLSMNGHVNVLDLGGRVAGRRYCWDREEYDALRARVARVNEMNEMSVRVLREQLEGMPDDAVVLILRPGQEHPDTIVETQFVPEDERPDGERGRVLTEHGWVCVEGPAVLLWTV